MSTPAPGTTIATMHRSVIEGTVTVPVRFIQAQATVPSAQTVRAAAAQARTARARPEAPRTDQPAASAAPVAEIDQCRLSQTSRKAPALTIDRIMSGTETAVAMTRILNVQLDVAVGSARTTSEGGARLAVVVDTLVTLGPPIGARHPPVEGRRLRHSA